MFQVEGMKARQEYVVWAEETTVNIGRKEGTHPTVERTNYPKTTTLHYCYYEPDDSEYNSNSFGIFTLQCKTFVRQY